MDKTPASTVRVAATVTSVDVIGAVLVCPVGALENVAGKDVDGVGHPHRVDRDSIFARDTSRSALSFQVSLSLLFRP